MFELAVIKEKFFRWMITISCKLLAMILFCMTSYYSSQITRPGKSQRLVTARVLDRLGLTIMPKKVAHNCFQCSKLSHDEAQIKSCWDAVRVASP
jgi:hypothetical protein